MTKKRILFLSEAGTLAHVVRPLVLAQKLNPAEFDVLLALDSRYNRYLGDLGVPVRYIRSVDPKVFERAVARGSFFFSKELLEREVEEDRKVIAEFRPDCVVSDLRLSTTISARVEKVPLVCLTNVHWSPFADIPTIVPEIFWTRVFGRPLTQLVFSACFPLGSRLLAKPFVDVKKRYGLPSIASDFLSIACDAELTLYADIPGVPPMQRFPDSHQFLGPVSWQAEGSLPHWWEAFLQVAQPGGPPRIYLNLGSSGIPGMADKFASKLLDLGGIVVAVGLRDPSKIRSDRFFSTPFLPNHAILPHCDLYINNGGVTCQQGFEYGVPYIGLAHNMDQVRNGFLMERAGVGVSLPVFHTRPDDLLRVARNVLGDDKLKERVLKVQKQAQKFDLASAFTEKLKGILCI